MVTSIPTSAVVLIGLIVIVRSSHTVPHTCYIQLHEVSLLPCFEALFISPVPLPTCVTQGTPLTFCLSHSQRSSKASEKTPRGHAIIYYFISLYLYPSLLHHKLSIPQPNLHNIFGSSLSMLTPRHMLRFTLWGSYISPIHFKMNKFPDRYC